jgi:hypothetical protein
MAHLESHFAGFDAVTFTAARQNKPGAFDDRGNTAEKFWGLVATSVGHHGGAPLISVFSSLDRDHAVYQQGVASDDATAGLRVAH